MLEYSPTIQNPFSPVHGFDNPWYVLTSRPEIPYPEQLIPEVTQPPAVHLRQFFVCVFSSHLSSQ